MNFRTEIELPVKMTPICPEDRLLFIGSCFAENIGMELLRRKFLCTVNPFGVLYNPASICLCMQETLCPPAADSIFRTEHGWSSWLHDSTFTRDRKAECTAHLQQNIIRTRQEIEQAHTLFITLGTNHAYRLKSSGIIVGNCHKQPARLFDEEIMSIEECVHELETTVTLCHAANPSLRIVFTVSPYRYAKYGFHGNQLSKSTLLLAVDSVCKKNPETCFYFPAYEILLDELRDYRFYKEDMLHPSAQAISYIWECFQKVFFQSETQQFIQEWEEIKKAMEHKPLHPESEAYRLFLSKTLLKLESIQKKYPNLALSYEFDWLSSRLK